MKINKIVDFEFGKAYKATIADTDTPKTDEPFFPTYDINVLFLYSDVKHNSFVLLENYEQMPKKVVKTILEYAEKGDTDSDELYDLVSDKMNWDDINEFYYSPERNRFETCQGFEVVFEKTTKYAKKSQAKA